MTVDDIKLEDNIFGPDIGVLKGKINKSKHKPVKGGVVEIPTEIIDKHKDLTHFMDIVFVN